VNTAVGEDKKKMMSKMFAEPDLVEPCSASAALSILCSFRILRKSFRPPRLCGENGVNTCRTPIESAGSRSATDADRWTPPTKSEASGLHSALRYKFIALSGMSTCRRDCRDAVSGAQPKLVIEPGTEESLPKYCGFE